MKKILISGLGGSLFPYLHHKLINNFELFYVDLDKELSNIYPDFNFYPAPPVSDELYESFIENIIGENKIDIYIPLIDEEIEKSYNIKLLFPNLILIVPNKEFSMLCLNKEILMLKLSELNISQIATKLGSELIKSDKFPVFVKPKFGRGSRGIRVINSFEEFGAYLLLEKYKSSDIIVQENIKGVEYTIGVLTNNLNQILSISTKRIITKKGITIHALTENNSIIEDAVFKINNQLKPCGPYNVQLFLDDNKTVKIFEINPRFSTTSIMSYEGGLNEIEFFHNMYNKISKEPILRPKSGINLKRTWLNNFYE